MTYHEESRRAFTASGAIPANRLVKLSGGKVALAGATEQPIGVSEIAAFADGDAITVRLLNTDGTIEMTASAAVAAGAVVYGTANGKIDDADPGSGKKVGIALEAATADGDVIEVMPDLPV